MSQRDGAPRYLNPGVTKAASLEALAVSILIAAWVGRIAVAQSPTPTCPLQARSAGLPPSASVMLNASVAVPLRIDDACGVIGFNFGIVYDPGIVRATSVATTGFTSGCTFLPPNIDNETGKLCLFLACPLPMSGPGDLITITFQGAAAGGSTLRFSASGCPPAPSRQPPEGCLLNEGIPACTPSNGGILVEGPTATPTPSGTHTATAQPATQTAAPTNTATALATATDKPTSTPTAPPTGTATITVLTPTGTPSPTAPTSTSRTHTQPPTSTPTPRAPVTTSGATAGCSIGVSGQAIPNITLLVAIAMRRRPRAGPKLQCPKRTP
jgi:hypothetical protein